MRPQRELAGRRFGKVVALQRAHLDNQRRLKWLCECDCGATLAVREEVLVKGRRTSCTSCAVSATNTTHGQSRTPLYERWRAMLQRTGNPNNPEYVNYGGRGIGVCERWMSFAYFATDMAATFSPDLMLDRIDVNGGYEPNNCRWTTNREQQRNKRTNHVVAWRGRSMVVQDWGELLGIKPNTIIHRLRRGWTIERALTKGADPDALIELVREVCGG